MVGSNDIDLYSDEHVARFLQTLSNGGGKGSPTVVVNGESNPHITKNSIGVTQNQLLDGTSADGDVSMADAAGAGEEEKGKEVTSTKEPTEETAIGGESKQTDDKEGSTNTNTNGNGDAQSKENAKDAGQLSNAQKEQAGPLLASEADEASFVHPMFLPPASAKPDRNMGIPENEAEDIRRLLALYVQKQEEVTRGATRLHQGLLRAERLRSNVLHWAKAEAHCGPNRDMSDGEDWYDKEEWGLTEDLKKGQDEEEEDTTTTGKKTRNRRT